MLLDENGNIWDEVEFETEELLESIVFRNYRLLYGDNTLLFGKKIIKTEDGRGTVPDGYIVDVDAREWYLVEVELLHHGIYEHIVPQITKQANAASTPAVKAILRQNFISQIQASSELRQVFKEAEIPDIEISTVIEEILNKRPKISIPIDNVSPDLIAWAQSLKYEVEIKRVMQFRNRITGTLILQFPDLEERTSVGGDVENDNQDLYSVSGADLLLKLVGADILSVGQQLYMRYRKKDFTATVTDSGQLELWDKTKHSASLAAIRCVQTITPDRKTANGLREWKTNEGLTLRVLRQELFAYGMKKRTP